MTSSLPTLCITLARILKIPFNPPHFSPLPFILLPSSINSFPGVTTGKEPTCQCRKHKRMWVQSLGREDSPGEGNGNPLQYSCLEIPIDRGAWRATVHGMAKRQTQLGPHAFHFSTRDRHPYLTDVETGLRGLVAGRGGR